MTDLDFSFSVASGRLHSLFFLSPLEGDLPSSNLFPFPPSPLLWVVFLLHLVFPSLSFPPSTCSSEAPRCIQPLTPNKDGTPGWREVPSHYLHTCARLSPLEVPSGEGGAVAGVNTPPKPLSSIFWYSLSSMSLFPSQIPNSGLSQGHTAPLDRFGGGGRSPENRPSHSLY